MSLLHKLHLQLSTPMQASLFALGEQAKHQGRHDLAAECVAAAAHLGNDRVHFKLSALDFFANACDQARSRNAPAEVEALEGLIKAIKSGEQHRISAQLNFGGARTPGEVEAIAERAARIVIQSQGG